jgi:hypothetical protein
MEGADTGESVDLWVPPYIGVKSSFYLKSLEPVDNPVAAGIIRPAQRARGRTRKRVGRRSAGQPERSVAQVRGDSQKRFSRRRVGPASSASKPEPPKFPSPKPAAIAPRSGHRPIFQEAGFPSTSWTYGGKVLSDTDIERYFTAASFIFTHQLTYPYTHCFN